MGTEDQSGAEAFLRERDSVLPYLKATVADESDRIVHLSLRDSPVFRPFVGSLVTSYVVDEGAELRLVTEAERVDLDLAVDRLHEHALRNLARRVGETGVRLVPYGKITAVLFDGNFEATLMLLDDFWPSVHEKLGPELIAVAPARDVLAVANRDGIVELRAVLERLGSRADHPLTPDIYRREGGSWHVFDQRFS